LYFYSVYGLIVESEIAFPELPVLYPDENRGATPGNESGNGSEGAPDNRVVVRRGEAARRKHGTSFATETAGEVFVAHENIGGFLMRGGREILFACEAEADEGAVRLFLLGTALAVLLHQRGNLVLHASAVAVDGGAVAFLGASGQGKSTTAAALHALGYDLVADDLVPVMLSGANTLEHYARDRNNADKNVARPTVFPGFPQLKLWPEAAAALHASQLHELHPHTTKRASRISEGFRDRPLPLRRVFVLDSDAEDVNAKDVNVEDVARNVEGFPHEYSCGGDNARAALGAGVIYDVEKASRIQLLGPREACMELVRHSYCFPMIDELRRENGASHLAQCADLAKRVAVCRLRSRFADKGLSALPDLAKLVLEDLAADDFKSCDFKS